MLIWNKGRAEIVDLIIDVGRDEKPSKGWGFSVIQLAGDGGAFLYNENGHASKSLAYVAADRWFELSQRKELMDRFLGWFDNPNESTPAWEPNHQYCPYCTDSYTLGRGDTFAVSLMIPADFKSYFYRCHRDCYEKDADLVKAMEDVFIDLIARQMEVESDGE